jgi:Tol biopolymer transport system component
MTQFTSGPAIDGAPAWSPDGTTIAFSRQTGSAPSDIWVVRPGSTPQAVTTTPGFWEGSPAWAPDATHMSFSRACAGAGSEACGIYPDMRGLLVIRRLADGIEDPVTLAGGSSWSPDGRKIVFDSGWDAGTLSLANADGTGIHEIDGSDWYDPDGAGVGIDYGPSWSPDGTRIAYVRSRGGTGIAVTRPDGTGRLNLIPADGSNATRPSWSPDGQSIAFSNNGDGEVWVMRADGTDRHAITSGLPSGLSAPDWQPVPIPAPVTPIVAPVVGITPPSPSVSTGTVDPRCLRYPTLIRATTAKMVVTQGTLTRAKRPAAKRAAVKRLRMLAAQRASYRKALRTRC